LEPCAFWHNRFHVFGLSSQFHSLLCFGGQFQSLLHRGLLQEGEHLFGFATGPALFLLHVGVCFPHAGVDFPCATARLLSFNVAGFSFSFEQFLTALGPL
jgi:hypothetical protein